MKAQFDGYNWLVRLDRGELMIKELTQFVKDQKIGAAWLSILGAAEWAELGFYDLKNKSFVWKKLDFELEITALQGNLAWEGEEPILHIHGSFSDKNMQGYGGHVKELEVGGTCEILIHHWSKDKLTRSFDADTGLKLLDL
jgi:hypothetical protein